jgi:hypothetical protein
MQIDDDVVSKKLDDQEVILHLKSGTYFGLNPTGTFLFGILKKGSSKDALVQALIEEYAITKNEAQADVETFLNTLRKHQLICGES